METNWFTKLISENKIICLYQSTIGDEPYVRMRDME